MTLLTRSLSLTAFSSAGLLLGASLLPAGSAFASDGCGDDATLVSDGICEVTFTETPASAWTPPAGITKLQALLVGGGGAVDDGDDYGGGGGEVILVELSTTGSVDVTVGAGGLHDGDVGSHDSTTMQGSDLSTADGGENSQWDGMRGGNSGNSFLGGEAGGGGGAGGDAVGRSGGAGVVVSDIADGFDLFAADDRCFGGGGVSTFAYRTGSSPNYTMNVYDVSAACDGANGGWFDFPDIATEGGWRQFAGDDADVVAIPTLANTGQGGATLGRYVDGLYEDGSDGLVAIRYDAALASTGVDVTGSLTAAAVLVTAGAIIATRRRKASN